MSDAHTTLDPEDEVAAREAIELMRDGPETVSLEILASEMRAWADVMERLLKVARAKSP